MGAMEGSDPLKLTSLEVENILRLKACSLVMNGEGALIVEGANEAGKSSVLRSLEILLAGMSKTPDEPIHGDEKKGKIVGKFGDIVVTKTFTRGKRPALKVSSAGAKYSSPQKLLESLLDHVALDPLRFIGMTPAEQLKTLSDLMGVDTTAIDEKHAAAFEARRVANREVRDLEGSLAKIAVPEDLPESEIKISDLMEQLDEINKHNERGGALQKAQNEAGAALFHAQKDVKDAQEEFEAAKAALEATKAHLATCKEAFEKSKATAIEFEPLDDTEVRGKIAKADEINAQIRDAQRAKELADKLDIAKKEADALDARVDTLDKERETLMTSAREKLPVEELALTDDGVSYKGKPLAQAGSSAQLRVSVAVAMALNQDKRIRLLLIDDAEKLDKSNTALVLRMAREAGFQVLMTRVGEGQDAAVVIEDGVVSNE